MVGDPWEGGEWYDGVVALDGGEGKDGVVVGEP